MKTQNLNLQTKLSKLIVDTKMILLFACLCIASICSAQDKIVLRNGNEIDGKVIEIGEDVIQYNTAENARPYRTILKKDVFMIKYENGTKEIFKEEYSGQPPVQQYHPAAQPVYANDNVFDSDTSDFAKLRQKKFGGPRVGYTFLSAGTSASYLESINKRPQFVQFGWQFETVLFTAGQMQGLVEFVPLIGGFEQGLFIPSISIMLGIRGGEGQPFEFALGPNFSFGRDYKYDLVGTVGLVLAVGTSFRKDKVNFPVSLAFVPSVGSKHDVTDPTTKKTTSQDFETGFRISLLVGFNTRKR